MPAVFYNKYVQYAQKQRNIFVKTASARPELFTKDIPALYYADNKNKGAPVLIKKINKEQEKKI